MLPVYNAISLQFIIEKGGRTRPWVVDVDTGNGVKPYVVKLFTTEQITERNSVQNEVLGSILAEKFKLPTPNAAYIEFNIDFKKTLDEYADNRLNFVDDRLKFGCEYISPNQLFDPDVHKQIIRDKIEAKVSFLLIIKVFS